MCPLQKPIFLFTRGNIFLRQLDSEYRVLAVRCQIWDSLNYEAAGACLDKREFFSVFQQANGADFAVDAGNDRLATVRPAKNMQIQTVFFRRAFADDRFDRFWCCSGRIHRRSVCPQPLTKLRKDVLFAIANRSLRRWTDIQQKVPTVRCLNDQMCKMLKATYAAQTITKERNETSRMY